MLPSLCLRAIAPDDLRIGDLVPKYVDNRDDPECARILRIEPRFNPLFIPVVFEHAPHTAEDIDRGFLFYIVTTPDDERRHWSDDNDTSAEQ